MGEITDDELDLIKAIELFNSQDADKQWEFVELYRDEGELIVTDESTIFKMDMGNGLSGEFKLKEKCTMETLLRVFGFNYKINQNE